MLTPRFDIDSLTTNADQIAWLVPADHLFTLVSRSVVLPSGWAALAIREHQDPLIIHAGGRCQEQNTLEVLFIRSTSIECVAEESALQSSDGFPFRGSMHIRVRIIPEQAEIHAFRKTVLSSAESASITDLQRYLHWAMREVLVELVAGRPVADLLKPLDNALVQRTVEEKLGPVCLAGGLAVEGSATVHLESPAYLEHCRDEADTDRKRRRKAAQLQIQQALTAARNEQLTYLVKILEQMREASADHENPTIKDLLAAFNETDRAEMYEALLHLCPRVQKTRFVAVISGQEVLFFDPADMGKPSRRIGLPETLGALRSITVDAASLQAGVALVGAAAGLHLIDINTGGLRESLPVEIDRTKPVRGGFNAAAMTDEHIWATHSELGLIRWPRKNHPDTFFPPGQLLSELTGNANTVRNVQVAEGHIWFTIDEMLWALSLPDGGSSQPVAYPGSAATLSAVTVANGMVIAGNVDGRIIAWDVGEPESARIIRGMSAGPVESIDVVGIGGVDRLIVADRSNALLAMIIGDNYCCRYESKSLIVRRAAAGEDLFVAINDSRDRLIAWNPQKPAQPLAVVIIPHITGNSIQDICLI